MPTDLNVPENSGQTTPEGTTISKANDPDFHMRFFRTDAGTFCHLKSPSLAQYAKDCARGVVGDSMNIPLETDPTRTTQIPLYAVNTGFADVPPIFEMSTGTYGKYLPYLVRSPKIAEGITFAWPGPIRVSRAREIATCVKDMALESITEFIRPFSISVTISESTLQAYAGMSEGQR
jgi:hypothetical protein